MKIPNSVTTQFGNVDSTDLVTIETISVFWSSSSIASQLQHSEVYLMTYRKDLSKLVDIIIRLQLLTPQNETKVIREIANFLESFFAFMFRFYNRKFLG